MKRPKPLDTSSSPLDMFGNPNPHYRPPEPRQAARQPAVPGSTTPRAPSRWHDPGPTSRSSSTESTPLPAGLTEEAIASFDAAGIEARFEVPDLGEVWLVSERSGHDRVELTARDLAGLARVVAVFDGARVVSIERAAAAT